MARYSDLNGLTDQWHAVMHTRRNVQYSHLPLLPQNSCDVLLAGGLERKCQDANVERLAEVAVLHAQQSFQTRLTYCLG